MIDQLKALIKDAVREVLAEGQGPLMSIEDVAKMLRCKDARTARAALADRGIPVERIGRGYFVNREHLEVIGRMPRAGRLERVS